MVDPISAALLAAGLSGTLSIGGVTVAASSIAAYAIVGGVVVGGAILVNELQAKKHVDDQQTVKQATPPRVRAYGRVLVGGSYYFFAANYVLVSGFVLCEGPIDGFEEHWFNGQISPDGGALQGHADMYPWNQQVAFTSQLGDATTSAQGAIAFWFSSWDESHRLEGLAATVMTCSLPANPSKNFTKFFPSGVPAYLARLRGCLVFDPRDATQSQADPTSWKWSQNPALCIMDFMTSSRGMNIPASRMNLAAFSAMADTCDEQVPLGVLGQAADNGSTASESRYLLWGTYSLDEEPKAVLERMLKTCDGELYPIPDGTIGLRGGSWTDPTVTIDDTMILSVDARRGVNKLAKFNQLRIRTVSVYNQFQVVEGDPWDDVAAQQASGEVLPQDFELVMVPSYTQGQRLAKIFMAKGNPAWIVTVTTTLAGLDALGERVVQVVIPDFGIDEPMFVNGFEIVNDAQCKLTLGSLSSAAYEWSTSEEGNAAPASGMVSQLPPVPPAVTGLALSLGRTQVNSSTAAAFIVASITPPTDTTLQLVAQYRLDGAASWMDMSVDNTAYTATSDYLTDGAKYDVQVALETYGGTIGTYATGTITAVSDATPPALPTSFGAAVQAGGVTLSWTNSNSDNFGGVQLFRGKDTSFADAILLTTVYGAPSAGASYTDKPGPGSWSYWIDAINESGVASATVGPQSVIV